jgi:hypothetical protein
MVGFTKNFFVAKSIFKINLTKKCGRSAQYAVLYSFFHVFEIIYYDCALPVSARQYILRKLNTKNEFPTL